MTTRRLQAVAALVASMALLQVLFEDAVMFVAITRETPSGSVTTPYVLVGVSLFVSLSTLAVLLGGALVHSKGLR